MNRSTHLDTICECQDLPIYAIDLTAYTTIYCNVLHFNGSRQHRVKVNILTSNHGFIPQGIQYVNWYDFITRRRLKGTELAIFKENYKRSLNE